MFMLAFIGIWITQHVNKWNFQYIQLKIKDIVCFFLLLKTVQRIHRACAIYYCFAIKSKWNDSNFRSNFIVCVFNRWKYHLKLNLFSFLMSWFMCVCVCVLVGKECMVKALNRRLICALFFLLKTKRLNPKRNARERGRERERKNQA